MIARTTSAALVVLALLGLTAVPGSAQQGLEIGVRGGVSVAGAALSSNQRLDKSDVTGFVGSVFMNYDAGLLGFQVAGQYTQKGVELDFGTVIDELSLSYFEIPAVIKLGLPLEGVKPSVFGGAALGFNTGCDYGGDDCKADFKSTDVSGIMGADVAIYLGKVSLWIDGRYHLSFSDINEASDLVNDLKHRNWTFQAGLAFQPGG